MGDGEVVGAMGQWIVGAMRFQKIFGIVEMSPMRDKRIDEQQGKTSDLGNAESRNLTNVTMLQSSQVTSLTPNLDLSSRPIADHHHVCCPGVQLPQASQLGRGARASYGHLQGALSHHCHYYFRYLHAAGGSQGGFVKDLVKEMLPLCAVPPVI